MDKRKYINNFVQRPPLAIINKYVTKTSTCNDTNPFLPNSFQPEDNVEHFAATYRATDNPVLVVRGPLYCVGETYIRVGKRIFSGGSELQNAFFIMIKTHYFFNLKFEQSLANFFSFFTSAVLNVSKPSTTTNGFLLQLR